MVTTLSESVVRAFREKARDQIREDSPADAIRRGIDALLQVDDLDNQPDVIQECILMAPGIVASLRSVAEFAVKRDVTRIAETDLVLRQMHDSMLRLVEASNQLFKRGIALSGVEAFQDAIAEIRFILADLRDPTPAECFPEASTNELETLASDLPAPQAWYNEDFRAVRGPVIQRPGE